MARVSVVLIFLNEERFLGDAVRSVRDQTMTDWELILVDDGSTDRSSEIARRFESEDSRITYLTHPQHQNRGMAASRNLGVAHASAPYVAFIDGDDVWVPTKLAEQVDLLDRMPDVAMVNGAILYWHSWPPGSTAADHRVLTGGFADQRLNPPEAALRIYPLATKDGAGVDLLVRREVFDAVGGFEEQFRGMFEDQSFLVKVFLKYPVFISSQVWLLYRQHEMSACARTSHRAYLKIRAVFLDWLQGEVLQLDDPRVTHAYQLARRRLRRQWLALPFVHIGQIIRGWVPRRLKQRLRGGGDQIPPSTAAALRSLTCDLPRD